MLGKGLYPFSTVPLDYVNKDGGGGNMRPCLLYLAAEPQRATGLLGTFILMENL